MKKDEGDWGFGCLIILILIAVIVPAIIVAEAMSYGIDHSKPDNQTFFCGTAGGGIVWERVTFWVRTEEGFRPMTSQEYQAHCGGTDVP